MNFQKKLKTYFSLNDITTKYLHTQQNHYNNPYKLTILHYFNNYNDIHAGVAIMLEIPQKYVRNGKLPFF
ncbi:hypothetical protein [Aquimarina sp. MMG016]|uniref:hypothetical protein n=1 Tax=Aquimarina sp. MMG016 TaxID=2822690 RepID=UPI001B3A2032|nr:hypothetical protein [Aquimarina sp. MMG016]MBQ4820610.1 hypothetical protein [Aquimarina sp. MMG016]